MVRKYIRKKERKYTVSDLKNAVKELSEGMSQRNVALKYGIPKTTLQNNVLKSDEERKI